jgi:tight adherence protein C
MITHQYTIAALVFFCIAGGIYAVLTIFDARQSRIRARLDLLQGNDESIGSTVDAGAATTFFPRFSQLLLGFLPHWGGDNSQLLQRLTQAGIYQQSAVANFLVIKSLLTVVPPIVTVAVALGWSLRIDYALLAGCMLGAFGAIAPGLWLDRRTTQQHRMLRCSLPDFLDLMIVCLEGGLSIQESVRRVGEELQLAHPQLGTELAIVQRDIELGSSVAQALKRFATRSNYEGVRTLSTFIRESQRFGTNLSEALRLHSDMLRSQREQAAEEMAQKAAVKILLPTLLCIFPAIFVVLVGPAIIQIQEAFATK